MKLNTVKILGGIYTREKALTGPLTVQIDITNACNNSCLYCWARSPLLKDRKADKKWESHFIPKDKIISLLDEFKILNVKKIHFAGGGEPARRPLRSGG